MRDDIPSRHHEQRKFDRLLDRLQARVPERWSGAISWLVSPAARLVRLPLGLLFIAGGVFAFLPVLGVWMIPLVIVLIAVDVASVRRQVVRTWPMVEARWRLYRSRRPRRAE